MLLSWSDQTGIARALIRTYPDTDRLALGVNELRSLITSLPGFAGPPHPPSESYLRSILWTWMRLADDGGTA